jgi:riboflavin biosynthesis pyrimidine reductase
MGMSADGRTLHSRWRPEGQNAGALYERVHETLGGDAWLVGRTTGQEFAKRKTSYPEYSGPKIPREAWFAQHDARVFGVVLDAHGKIAWGRSDIGGDPIVAILTERVADAHLAGLHSEGVSYLFAGEDELDLHLALNTLGRRLGVKRLLLEGGGKTNGAFLREGLIDEVNLLVFPALDGAQGAPSVFDSDVADGQRAPLEAMELVDSQRLDRGVLLLRYRLRNSTAVTGSSP